MLYSGSNLEPRNALRKAQIIEDYHTNEVFLNVENAQSKLVWI